MDITVIQTTLLRESFADYLKLLHTGISIDLPLEAQRKVRIAEIERILSTIETEREGENGDTTRDSSGSDLVTGRDHAQGDNGDGHRTADRGHSSEGTLTADRGDSTAGRTVPDTVGSEENASTPTDGSSDDTSNGELA